MAMVSKSYILKQEKGFTIIELVLVVVILGILATLVYPSASDIISSQRLQSTAKEILSDLRIAQQLAISKENNTRIIFNNSSSTPPNTYFVKNVTANETIKEATLPPGITINTSKIIDFNIVGTTQNDTITLKNTKGETLFVVVYMKGRFRITEIEP
ncbi:MAG: pilus assembly FimT family protein [Bacillota bacterium]